MPVAVSRRVNVVIALAPNAPDNAEHAARYGQCATDLQQVWNR